MLKFRGHALNLAQIALVVAPSFVLFGYNQAGVGGLLSLDSWVETFPEIDTVNTSGAKESHNATIQGLVVATFVLGAIAGSFSCMYIGDVFGRRKCIFGAALCTLIGEILCTSSFHLAQFVVGRSIIGFGIGILSATVPVWQAECSPAANRGKHVVLDGLFMTFGYTLESWINFGFYQIKSGSGSVSWRAPLGIPIAISLIPMAAIFLLPESPRWLLKVSRVEEATATLSALKDLPIDDSTLNAEIEGIRYALNEGGPSKISIREMFSMGEEKLFYRFCLCILLQFYQQMSGSNLISVYASILFQQKLGMGSEVSRILTGGTLTWKFLSSFVAFFTIDRFGRRALFMFSGVGMGSCMLALAVGTSFPEDNKSAAIASAFFIFMYNFFVPIGFLGANFLYCAEVAPVKLRVSMASISTANHWLWNFVVIMATPVAISSIGWKYFLVFMTISFCIPLSVYLYFPETMGQSLEQIDAVFRDHDTPLKIVRASKLMSKGDVQKILYDEEKKITSANQVEHVVEKNHGE
ncbi:putative mfs sugar transporter [Phaeomoniella chlamydospora]|uniref:Putative mfs sugar transporter n=1 Tax=Phaeomoniella chlamydospora TaxID=158046 RepID=A0A0G2E4Z0_PHACM|nr:putative mfs sugar transporter [Phaeomoniella chlamydospora]